MSDKQPKQQTIQEMLGLTDADVEKLKKGDIKSLDGKVKKVSNEVK